MCVYMHVHTHAHTLSIWRVGALEYIKQGKWEEWIIPQREILLNWTKAHLPLGSISGPLLLHADSRRVRRKSHLHYPAVIFICGGNEVVSSALSVAVPDIQIDLALLPPSLPSHLLLIPTADQKQKKALVPASLIPKLVPSLGFYTGGKD